jgi:hypothetical protein
MMKGVPLIPTALIVGTNCSRIAGVHSRMSTNFPLTVRKTNRGPKPKDGERYPSGGLKPQGPTPELLAHRRSIAADPAMGENPLDAAFSNGWLTADHRRLGKLYASVHRAASIGGPKANVTVAMGEAVSPDVFELDLYALRSMAPADVVALWDRVFSEVEPDKDRREARAVRAMAQWRALNAAMTPAQRDEVFQVCVAESWPQWFVQRTAGERVRAQAVAERRALTDGEQALIGRRFSSSFERKRDLLTGGLEAIAKALQQGRKERRGRPSEVRPDDRSPARAAPASGYVSEVTEYVDQDGAPLYTVERRRRR